MTDSDGDVLSEEIAEIEPPAPTGTDLVEVSEQSPHPHEEPPPSKLEQYVQPLLLPLLIVGGVIFYVINLSRVFLASSETVAVVVATVITVGILFGGAMISAAPRMRTSSIILITLGFFAAILMAGALTIGASKPHEENLAFPSTALKDPKQVVKVESFNLGFTPKAFAAGTGFVDVTLTNTQPGSHTFTWENPDAVFDEGLPQLDVSGEGDEAGARAFIPAAGDYVFYCSIPGHRAAGMEGVVTVTGNEITVEEASATQVEPEAAAGG